MIVSYLLTFSLCVITGMLLIYMLYKADKNSSVPFVTRNWYPVVGHLFVFLHDGTTFIVRCCRKYGPYFSLRVLNQHITFLLSPYDWKIITRNKSFYFPGSEFAEKVFDMSSDCFRKFINVLNSYLKLIFSSHRKL